MERATARDRLSRLRDENLADQAADAAGLDEGSRDRLERLEAGLRALPDAEVSALLLRELDGLTYEEIAKAAGVTSAGARQAVFRGRVGLQGDPDPPTAHCNEVRVAMSKAETSVRDRRSITAHLERCPVCAEFADELEQRPDDLKLLFSATPAVAAEGEEAAGATAAAAGVALGAAGGEELAEAAPEPARHERRFARNGDGEGEGDGASPPARPTARRARRGAFAPLLLVLLLVGGGVALAVALSSGGGKSHPKRAVGNVPAQTPSTPRPAVPARKAPKGHKAGKAHKTHKAANKPHRGAKKRAAKKHHAKRGATAVAAAPGTAKAAGGQGSTSSTGGTSRQAGGTSSSGTESSNEPRGLSTLPSGVSSAQAAYSGRGGTVQQQLSENESGLPSTGLQIALVVAAAFFLVGLGLTIRGLTYPRP